MNGSRKRKYTKKNKSYWESLAKKDLTDNFKKSNDAEPDLVGSPIYVSTASYSRNSGLTGRATRSQELSRTKLMDEYGNLSDLDSPFHYHKGTGRSDAKESIFLCQKAYYHIPIFRNTIDLMAELSDTELFLSGGTKGSREFIKKWMESAKINSLKSQFFREWYRSGNVFLYRTFADFTDSEISAMKTIYAKNYELIEQTSGFPTNSLPLRYILLNPCDIVNYESLTGANSYKKALTKFESARLKNPTSEEEKRILERLKKEDTTGLNSINNTSIYIDLEPERVMFIFYKKQDYEPFSVPFGFPVLKDINWKLELKKIDQSVSRSLENIILLITMGAEPDKGGINPRNLEITKQLFSSEAIGRVLVADYTTKANFVVPDIDKVLGKEKYEIVNQDIKEGLQNIIFEEAKYSNSEIKIKIFFEKLKEARNMFIEEFLQPEIKKVCSAIGFRNFPKVRFKSASALTDSDIQKAAIRLIELGVLTPDQGVESLNRRELPDASEIGEGQEEYRDKREDGMYAPLIGGPPLYDPMGEEGQAKSGAPIKVPPKNNGRPKKSSIASSDSISAKLITKVAQKTSEFESFAERHFKKSFDKKRLSKDQKEVVQKICASIIESSDMEEWKDYLEAFCSKELDIDKLSIKPEILDIAQEYNVTTAEASMIYHSKKI